MNVERGEPRPEELGVESVEKPESLMQADLKEQGYELLEMYNEADEAEGARIAALRKSITQEGGFVRSFPASDYTSENPVKELWVKRAEGKQEAA